MDTNTYETRLKARLRELTERMEDVEHQLDQPADPDREERSVEREDDELLETLGQTALDEVRQINAALDRIKKGTFGLCTSCGEPISSERLAIVPHAARCKLCA